MRSCSRKGQEWAIKSLALVHVRRSEGQSASASVPWPDAAIPAFLLLLLAVPTIVVEEDWRGWLMIEQPNHLW